MISTALVTCVALGAASATEPIAVQAAFRYRDSQKGIAFPTRGLTSDGSCALVTARHVVSSTGPLVGMNVWGRGHKSELRSKEVRIYAWQGIDIAVLVSPELEKYCTAPFKVSAQPCGKQSPAAKSRLRVVAPKDDADSIPTTFTGFTTPAEVKARARELKMPLPNFGSLRDDAVLLTYKAMVEKGASGAAVVVDDDTQEAVGIHIAEIPPNTNYDQVSYAASFDCTARKALGELTDVADSDEPFIKSNIATSAAVLPRRINDEYFRDLQEDLLHLAFDVRPGYRQQGWTIGLHLGTTLAAKEWWYSGIAVIFSGGVDVRRGALGLPPDDVLQTFVEFPVAVGFRLYRYLKEPLSLQWDFCGVAVPGMKTWLASDKSFDVVLSPGATFMMKLSGLNKAVVGLGLQALWRRPGFIQNPLSTPYALEWSLVVQVGPYFDLSKELWR